MLNRDLALPLHKQVRGVISERIKSGEYPLGSRMPNELELCKQLGVSRPTVRKALDELEEVGMITRVRPKGTFVSQTMKNSWFDDEIMRKKPRSSNSSVQPVIKFAMEDVLNDVYLINALEKFSVLSGSRVEFVHWENWYDALENLINTFVRKKSPDVFTVSNDAVGIFAKMGLIQPLDNFIESDRLAYIKQRCGKYGLGSYIYNGQLYAYPFFSETRMLLYRKDHFYNAGLEDPNTHPLTHDTFLEVGKRLSNPDKGLYAFAYPTDHDPRTLQSMMPWLIQRGGSMFKIDNGRILSTTEEPEFIEALKWYTDLILKHKICHPVPPAVTSKDILTMFLNGNISMMVSHPGIIKWFKESTSSGDGKFGIAPLPAGPINNYSFMGGMPLCISSTCKDSQAAWSLISHVTNKDILVPYIKRIGNFLPIELYDIKEIIENTDDFLKSSAASLETAVPHSYPVGYNQSLDLMSSGYWRIPIPHVLDMILREEISVEHAGKYLGMSTRIIQNKL